MDKVYIGAFDGTVDEAGRLEEAPHRDFRDVWAKGGFKVQRLVLNVVLDLRYYLGFREALSFVLSPVPV